MAAGEALRLVRAAVFTLATLLAVACSEKPRPLADAAANAHASANANADAAPALPANARVALTKPADADHEVIAAQEAVARDMNALSPWILLGHAWLRKAQANDDPAFETNADACASVVLAKDPDHAAAADLRFRVLVSRRELAEARRLAERSTAQHPTDARGWANLTDVLTALGRYDAANDAATKLMELGPSLAAYRRTSRLQWLSGDVTRAKQSIASALEHGAKSDAGEVAATLVDAAMISWHAGDYAGADERCDEALERSADFAAALTGKGRVAMARSEWARAADFFARSFGVHRSVEVAWLLGDAREAAGDAKAAADAYALVEKERARDPVTYSRFLATRKERISEAVEIVSEEHKKTVDVYTEDALAWALYRAGMLEPAKTALGRARALHTPDARIMFHEGAIRIAAGDVKKGREVVAKALATNRAFDWREAKEARALLDRK